MKKLIAEEVVFNESVIGFHLDVEDMISLLEINSICKTILNSRYFLGIWDQKIMPKNVNFAMDIHNKRFYNKWYVTVPLSYNGYCELIRTKNCIKDGGVFKIDNVEL